MKFNLLGKEIEISDGLKIYVKICGDFKKLADEACKKFNADLANYYIDKYENELDQYIWGFVASAREYLARFGVYTVTDEEIWNSIVSDNYERNSELQRSFSESWEKIARDAPDDETRETYILATMVKQLNSGCFDIPIRVDIMSLCDYVIKYLYENDKAEIDYVTKSNADKAKAIYKNLKSGNIPDKDYYDVIVTMIELDPTEKDYFEFAFNSFPENRHEIAKIANYLGLDLYDLYVNDITASFNIKSIKNEEDALKAKECLEQMMEYYGVDDCYEKKEIAEKLKKFDKDARTYKKIEYSTRELKAKAEKDDAELELKFNQHVINTFDKKTCQESISEIQNNNYTNEIADIYISDLKNRIYQIEEEEIKTICGNISDLSKDECITLISQLDELDYNKKLINKYKKLLEKQILVFEEKHLMTLCNGISSFDKEKCISVISEIEVLSYADELKKKYIDDLNTQIDVAENKMLNEWCTKLSEMNEQECELLKKQILDSDVSNTNKLKYTDLIDKRINSIWEETEFAEFKELYISVDPDNPDSIKECLNTVLSVGKTKWMKIYETALRQLNPQNVQTAAKYLSSKDKGIVGSIMGLGKGDIYKTLTLDDKVIHPAIIRAKEEIEENKKPGLMGLFSAAKSKLGSATQLTCEKCGTKVNQGSKFCNNCGNKMN